MNLGQINISTDIRITGNAKDNMQDRIATNRTKAKKAGFVNIDGTANTRGYQQQKLDQERETAQWADRMYWKDNPTGKYTTNDAPRGDDTGRSSNATVTGLVKPPKQVHPDDINKQTKRIKSVSDNREKTWQARNSLKGSGEL